MINKLLIYIKNKIEFFFKIKLKTSKSSDRFNKSVELTFNKLSKIKFNPKYSNNLTCIIFSKDRALQLYALLESMKLRCNTCCKIFIIYKTNFLNHAKSYEDLIFEIKNFNLDIAWVQEKKSFKDSLLKVLEKVKTKKLFYLTDDDIFINDINLNHVKNFNEKETIFSFRLSKNICYSYNLNRKTKQPSFRKLNFKNYFEFNWFQGDGEWAYPWSVNGHVFNLSDIKVLSEILDYKSPNSYEAALQDFNFLANTKLGICHEKSFIINLPVNITQNEIKNRHGNIKINEYLESWNNKKKLDINILKNYEPQSVHEEHVLRFIDR